jgi:uncharacterized protein (DUF3820 family)
MDGRQRKRNIQKILRSYSGTLRHMDNMEAPIMPFGIYKGKRASSVPAEYLIWLYDNDKVFGRVLKYIHDHEDELRHKAAKSQPRNR